MPQLLADPFRPVGGVAAGWPPVVACDRYPSNTYRQALTRANQGTSPQGGTAVSGARGAGGRAPVLLQSGRCYRPRSVAVL
jgi:hypothetical protein